MSTERLFSRYFAASYSLYSTRLLNAVLLFIASCAIPALGYADDLTVEIDGVTNAYSVDSYSTNDRNGNFGTAVVNGGAVTLDGIAWKSLTINHNVTSDTVLEFDFQSSGGKLSGIGLDTNATPTHSFAFRLQGIVDFGRKEFDGYTPSDTVHYVIPLGQLLHTLRSYQFLVLFNDASESTYSNIRLYERDGTHIEGSGHAFELLTELGCEAGQLIRATVLGWECVDEYNCPTSIAGFITGALDNNPEVTINFNDTCIVESNFGAFAIGVPKGPPELLDAYEIRVTFDAVNWFPQHLYIFHHYGEYLSCRKLFGGYCTEL